LIAGRAHILNGMARALKAGLPGEAPLSKRKGTPKTARRTASKLPEA
jgi:hypothetical protein